MISIVGIIASASNFDPDALAFINAAGITDGTQKSAINKLVLDLKGYSLWNRFHALYPFVGGSAAAHKFNLINPADTDGAFRITFAGGITHDANGVTFNGTTGYGDTHFVPSTSATLNDESLGVYSRTAAADATNGHYEMGVAAATTIRESLQLRDPSNNFRAEINTSTSLIGTVTDATGLFVGSRTSSTLIEGSRNGSVFTSNTASNTGVRTSASMYVGARNVSGVAGSFSQRNLALAFIGKGFSSAQVANLYTAIQAYQTSLSRQV